MTIAQTHQGRIEGESVSHAEGDLVVFKGVPYAAPPVGARRWMPPGSPEPWSGVRQAKSFGPAAHQNPIPLDILPAFNVGDRMDEDCLYLNVWTPGLDDAKRPVMVWIHGGAFVIGSGAQSLYDGGPLARRGDVVVVTVNYRLGPLGFLNLNEVTRGAIPATGNEGLLDQVAALEWVEANIEAFGGDRDNVTIFGESAGGMSVGCQLGLPRARGLFHRAIPQSGACHTAHTKDRAVRVAERVLGALGARADDVDLLRNASPARLLEIQAQMAMPGDADPDIGSMPFQPCVDGDVLPRLPIESVRGGSAVGVPVLVGSTRDEWKLFAPADPTLFTLHEDALTERVGAAIDGDGKPLIEAYRAARQSRKEPVTPMDLFVAIETDRVFRQPALALAEAQRAHATPAFNYLFTWESPAMGGMLGACHALELGFVFGTIDASGARDFSGSGAEADALQHAIQEAWLAFARTGDPSNAALGKWPAYRDARETLVLGAKSELQPAPREGERRAWEGVDGVGRI